MKQVSNSDFERILRLLYALSKTNGASVREKENARKAAVLHKKLIKRKAKENGNDCNTGGL